MSFPSDQRAQYRKLSVAGQFLRAWAGFEPATPSRSNRLNYQAEFYGGGGWIRTTGKRNQNPMPYRLATPPVLRQGIEPKAAAYESAALPLSYINNIRKELTPLWRSDSLRYSREFLLSKRFRANAQTKGIGPRLLSSPGNSLPSRGKFFLLREPALLSALHDPYCALPRRYSASAHVASEQIRLRAATISAAIDETSCCPAFDP